MHPALGMPLLRFRSLKIVRVTMLGRSVVWTDCGLSMNGSPAELAAKVK